MDKNKKMRLGDLLVSVGKITVDQLTEALKLQRETGRKIGETLVDVGYVTEEDIIEVLEFQLGISRVDLDKYFIDPETARLVSEKLARKHMLIPVNRTGNKLFVAMSDPLNILAIDDVKMTTGLEIKLLIAVASQIESSINQYYGKESAERAIKDFKEEYNIKDIDELDEEVLSDINNAPVVRLVNSIITQAVKAKASDIHIEPFENEVRIRFRIDGELQEIMTPTKSAHSPIVTRIKIMGGMDIAERRIPQDGRIETKVEGKAVDLRISVLPTVFGEKIVIRLLDRTSFLKNRRELGFSLENEKRVESVLKNPNGIILVTGPTGSGKSTTLYTFLRELNKENKNIITIEDPVEYKMNGINQVQVNTKTGLTFAEGLKSMLRQDPDIIIVGEIRDSETAQMATRAAITGHLVISTMHTNDASSAVMRLKDMGIDSYLIASSVVGVVAQRLVRKICDSCKQEHTTNEFEMNILNLNTPIKVYKGKGCASCYGTGYKGRTAIHEVLVADRSIRTHIDENKGADEIKDYAVSKGMITLRENCKQLVLSGETTVEELTRVTYNME